MKGLQNFDKFIESEGNSSFSTLPYLKLKLDGIREAVVKLLPYNLADKEEFALFATHYIKNKGSVLCTAKQHTVEDNYTGSPCPVCNELKNADDDIKKQSKVKFRWLIPLVVLITLDEKDSTSTKTEVMVFNTSTKTKFAGKLAKILLQNPEYLDVTDPTTFKITVDEENGFTTYDIKEYTKEKFNYGEHKQLIDEFYKENDIKTAYREATTEDADFLNPDDFKIRTDTKKNEEEQEDFTIKSLEDIV